MNAILFYIFGGLILIFSLLTVTSRKILRAAIYLLFVLMATTGIFFILNFNFLAAVQLTVYAGGIVVLIIFSIMLTSHISEKLEAEGVKKQVFALIGVIAGALVTLSVILNYKFVTASYDGPDTSMKNIGSSLLSYGNNGFVLPFEVISILLLASMVGAIILAKRQN